MKGSYICFSKFLFLRLLLSLLRTWQTQPKAVATNYRIICFKQKDLPPLTHPLSHTRILTCHRSPKMQYNNNQTTEILHEWRHCNHQHSFHKNTKGSHNNHTMRFWEIRNEFKYNKLNAIKLALYCKSTSESLSIFGAYIILINGAIDMVFINYLHFCFQQFGPCIPLKMINYWISIIGLKR